MGFNDQASGRGGELLAWAQMLSAEEAVARRAGLRA
jgi:hypothetical protein